MCIRDSPTENNCSVAEARAAVLRAYAAGRPVFHNATFDLDVAQSWFGLRPPECFEDTMYMAFLDDPRAQTLSLKPLAELHLGRKPKERDKLKAWILRHVPEAKEKDWGAYISRAPGALVGQYAAADTDMTVALAKKLGRRIADRGMLEAYDRELALTKVTLEMERGGVRLDVRRLMQERAAFAAVQTETAAAVYRRLGGQFELGSPKQLFERLQRYKKLTAVVNTEKGNPSVKMSVLRAVCNDQKLVSALAVHSAVEKYLNTFIDPWLAQAQDGYLHPSFHQVRARTEEGGGGGTRSGRYSSSNPNFQQVPADVDESKNRDTLLLLQTALAAHGVEFVGLRGYILPDPGCSIVSLDYSQQELRILAHFEADTLQAAYLKNPDLDVHEFFRQEIKSSIGTDYPRKHVKETVFGLIYGLGVEKLAARLDVPPDTARALRDALLKVLPGVKSLMRELKDLAAANKPLVTWGGRQYYCEPPALVNGRMRSFEYKMLNYLIQPSAADCTKVGMLNVAADCVRTRIALQVHDEIVCMVPTAHVKTEVPRLRAALENVKFGVPMRAEAAVSSKNWGELKK